MFESFKEESFSPLVSSQKPFGFRTFVTGHPSKKMGDVKLYANKSIGYVSKDEILQNLGWVDKYKIYTTRAYGAGEDFPHQILNTPIESMIRPRADCSESTHSGCFVKFSIKTALASSSSNALSLLISRQALRNVLGRSGYEYRNPCRAHSFHNKRTKLRLPNPHLHGISHNHP